MARSIVSLFAAGIVLGSPALAGAQSPFEPSPELGRLLPEAPESGYVVEQWSGTLDSQPGAFGSEPATNAASPAPMASLPTESANTPPVPEPVTTALGALALATALRRRLRVG